MAKKAKGKGGRSSGGRSPQGGPNRGPRSNKKNKGKGGGSPKRPLVVEPLPEDPAGAAAFDA
eukprot:COSAG06_NODE_20689_length_784_cov_1.225948_1_plen_61_part_01